MCEPYVLERKRFVSTAPREALVCYNELSKKILFFSNSRLIFEYEKTESYKTFGKIISFNSYVHIVRNAIKVL